MFVAPGTVPDFAHKFSREAAERVSRNWSLLLLNGLLLIVAGVLIFSIDWSIRSLATFIGALFILEGLTMALTTGIDQRVRRANVLTGLLSVAAGVAIIVWPGARNRRGRDLPWRVAHRRSGRSRSQARSQLVIFFPDWWMLLILGLLEVPLGVLALADPGATLGRDYHRQWHLGRRRRRYAGHHVVRGKEPPEDGRPRVQPARPQWGFNSRQASSGQPHSHRILIWPATSVRIDGEATFRRSIRTRRGLDERPTVPRRNPATRWRDKRLAPTDGPQPGPRSGRSVDARPPRRSWCAWPRRRSVASSGWS